MVHLIFHRIFFDVLQMISADWQDYTSNRSSSRIMMNTANLARHMSRWIVGMQVVAVFFYSAGVLAANVNSPEKLEPYERELILKMGLPFNISTNFIYTTVQIVQFYHLFFVAWGITSINSLFVTLVSSKKKKIVFFSTLSISDFIYWKDRHLIKYIYIYIYIYKY